MNWLLYVNLVLVLAGLALEVCTILKHRKMRFVRVVGAVGLTLLVAAYSSAILFPDAGMPTSFVRPGLVCLLAYIIARNIYDIYDQ